MAEFEKSIGSILANEGGLVDNPNDPGGTTNFGISLRWALQQMKESGVEDFDIDGDGDVDADDIKLLTAPKAMELYRKHFWSPDYNFLPQEVATKIFDMAVNMGKVRAHALAAQAASALTGTNRDADNFTTLTQVFRERNEESVRAALRAVHWSWYALLIARNAALLKNGIKVADFSVFSKGWRRRALL